uniref:BEN domain-containing protein n=1 Tax=Macrostomum lignano TaxID=282301 RepID=A0A1I8JMC4_9PLAT
MLNARRKRTTTNDQQFPRYWVGKILAGRSAGENDLFSEEYIKAEGTSGSGPYAEGQHVEARTSQRSKAQAVELVHGPIAGPRNTALKELGKFRKKFLVASGAVDLPDDGCSMCASYRQEVGTLKTRLRQMQDLQESQREVHSAVVEDLERKVEKLRSELDVAKKELEQLGDAEQQGAHDVFYERWRRSADQLKAVTAIQQTLLQAMHKTAVCLGSAQQELMEQTAAAIASSDESCGMKIADHTLQMPSMASVGGGDMVDVTASATAPADSRLGSLSGALRSTVAASMRCALPRLDEASQTARNSDDELVPLVGSHPAVFVRHSFFGPMRSTVAAFHRQKTQTSQKALLRLLCREVFTEEEQLNCSFTGRQWDGGRNLPPIPEAKREAIIAFLSDVKVPTTDPSSGTCLLGRAFGAVKEVTLRNKTKRESANKANSRPDDQNPTAATGTADDQADADAGSASQHQKRRRTDKEAPTSGDGASIRKSSKRSRPDGVDEDDSRHSKSAFGHGTHNSKKHKSDSSRPASSHRSGTAAALA